MRIPRKLQNLFIFHKFSYRFNTHAQIELAREIREGGYTFYAPPGTLYARVPLETRLSLDTEAGQLIGSHVSTLWLQVQDINVRAVPGAPTLADPARAGLYVYEAMVVNREDFNFEPKNPNPNYLYIFLSKQFVHDYALQQNQMLQVEIQFQLNRREFVQQQFALDQLMSPDLLFPNTMVQFNVDLLHQIHQLKQKYPHVEYASLLLPCFHSGLAKLFRVGRAPAIKRLSRTPLQVVRESKFPSMRM